MNDMFILRTFRLYGSPVLYGVSENNIVHMLALALYFVEQFSMAHYSIVPGRVELAVYNRGKLTHGHPAFSTSDVERKPILVARSWESFRQDRRQDQ